MDVHGRDLRYFVAVAEELHFTRAAERLFVSQPALSKQIRLLEKHLDATLFARDRRDVRLTPAGKALLPHARRVLEAWDEASAALEAAKAAEGARLTIGMSTSPGRGGLLPAIRSRFTSAFPGARLDLRQVGWEDPTAGLADGSSDVAFVWLPLPEDDRYARLVMAAEPRHVAFPDRHPLAAKHEVRIADLVDEPFLALPESAGPLRDFWLALDARPDGAVRIGAVVNNPDETYEALVDGRGVCLVAAGNAPLLTRGDVVTRPVVDIAPCHLALAWRGDDTRPLVRGYVRAATQFLERARVNAGSGDRTGAAAGSGVRRGGAAGSGGRNGGAAGSGDRTGAAAGSGGRRGGAAGSGDRTGAAAESAVRARAAVESAGGD